jgi:threonine aldolase
VARLGCTPAALTWQAGVDALSFGFVKNGAMSPLAIHRSFSTIASTCAAR